MRGKPRLTRVELWLVDLEACAPALVEFEARFPSLPTAAKKGPPEAQAAHIALRLLIARVFGPGWRRLPFLRSAAGKPSLRGLSGDFSLAHSGPWALVGLSARGRIGVDLQVRKRVRVAARRR